METNPLGTEASLLKRKTAKEAKVTTVEAD